MVHNILHVDIDAFFASVEQARDPSLRGKPVVVGGSSQRRGVVCAASYEARRYGIHSAMPLTQARRLCPDGVFVPGSHVLYAEMSDRVMALLETISPLVESMSLDEAYVDVTGSRRLFGPPNRIATLVRDRIRDSTSLPASVGIATNKLVAKVATDEAKPDGVLEVPPGRERAFLEPLDIGKLPGVGPRTRETFREMGVRTIGHLASVPPETFLRTFGTGAYILHQHACGIGSSEVRPVAGPPKSVSRETTFERDVADWSRLRVTITYLAERALYALRDHRMQARRVTLKVRYADFQTVTIARSFGEPTQLDTEVLTGLADLIDRVRDRRRARVRLVGVTLSRLSCDQRQMSLFPTPYRDRWRRALDAVDQIRHKYEFNVLRTARSLLPGDHTRPLTPALAR